MLGKVGQISTGNRYKGSQHSASRINAYKKDSVNPVINNDRQRDSFKSNTFLASFPWKIKNISIKPGDSINFDFFLNNYIFSAYVNLRDAVKPDSIKMNVISEDSGNNPFRNKVNYKTNIPFPLDEKHYTTPRLVTLKKLFQRTNALDISNEYIINDDTVLYHLIDGLTDSLFSEIEQLSIMIISFFTGLIKKQGLEIEFNSSNKFEFHFKNVEIISSDKIT